MRVSVPISDEHAAHLQMVAAANSRTVSAQILHWMQLGWQAEANADFAHNETLSTHPATSLATTGQLNASLARAKAFVDNANPGAVLLVPQANDDTAYRGQLVEHSGQHWVQQVSITSYVAHAKTVMPDMLRMHGIYEVQYRGGDRVSVLSLNSVPGLGLAPPRALRATEMRPAWTVAFETASRRDALKLFPELAGAYAILDAAGAKAMSAFPGDERGQRLSISATRANILRQLNKGLLPDASVVAHAMKQPGQRIPAHMLRPPKVRESLQNLPTGIALA